jgi:hypothetical protein
VSFWTSLFGKQSESEEFKIEGDDVDLDSPKARELLSKAKTKCTPAEFENLHAIVAALPAVSANKAKRFMQGADLDFCSGAASVERVLHGAAGVTSFNSGNFGELCRRAEVISTPIPHLRAFHSWQGLSDSFGTKTFYAVRVGKAEFLWGDHVDFG